MASEVKLWVTPVEGFPGLRYTSVYAYGYVFSYGQEGLQTNPVKLVQPPKEVQSLGKTDKSIDELAGFAYRLDSTEFKRSNYGVARNNCNYFANKLSNYTTGKDIPSKYLHQDWTVVKEGVKVGTIGALLLLSSFSRGTKNEQ